MNRWFVSLEITWKTKGPEDKWFSLKQNTGEDKIHEIILPDIFWYVLTTAIVIFAIK